MLTNLLVVNQTYLRNINVLPAQSFAMIVSAVDVQIVRFDGVEAKTSSGIQGQQTDPPTICGRGQEIVNSKSRQLKSADF